VKALLLGFCRLWPSGLQKNEEAGQADCRKMKKQAMAKRTADKEAGNGQATGLQENFLEILVSQAKLIRLHHRSQTTDYFTWDRAHELVCVYH
jgi:hypothetical protein